MFEKRKKSKQKKRRKNRSRRFRERQREIIRRIAEARRQRRKLLLLLLLLYLNLLRPLNLPLYVWSWPHFSGSINDAGYRVSPCSNWWVPSPECDYAPCPGHTDFCDGYSREQWDEARSKSAVGLSKTDQLIREWKYDPARTKFPTRYQEFKQRPTLPRLMIEMREPYWKADAFAAIMLLSPPSIHSYLLQAYATDPNELRRCYAQTSKEIIANFRAAALRWESRKKMEMQEFEAEKNDHQNGLKI